MRKGPGEVQRSGTFLKKALPQCGAEAEGGLISGIPHLEGITQYKELGFFFFFSLIFSCDS
jgi:hypothetical protein